jgi:hypothetical protein
MPVELGVRLARALGVTAEYLVDDSQETPPPPTNPLAGTDPPAGEPSPVPQTAALDDDARYLLRVIADAGLTPADVARQLLFAVKEASSRPLYSLPAQAPADLEFLDLPANAPTPNANAPEARSAGKPRRA